MKQYLIIPFILIFLNPSFGQKKIEIPDSKIVGSFIERMPGSLNTFNLRDLQTSTDSLNIRIWQTHAIFTLSYNNIVSSDYKIHTTNDKPIISTSHFSENISKIILDSILTTRIMELNNDPYGGIDGSFVFIEISTKDKYKIVSFWSPSANRNDDCKSVLQILSIINKTINLSGLRNEFLNSLEPGGYRWGMTSIRIDRFLNKDVKKKDFYSKVEKRIKLELNITKETNHWEYPLLIINDRPAKIAELNQFTDKEVEKFEILKPDIQLTALYGTNGSYGVIRLKTK